VVLEIRDRGVVRVRTFVGGRWRAVDGVVTDFGAVSAPEAATYFVELAERGESAVSRKAILPATLADSAEVWPALLRIARDETRPRRTRREALQWAGMAAGRVVTGGELLGPEDDDDEVQAAAVFAISQLKKDEAVPALIRIARTHSNPRVRKRALFWLGQSGDPRVIDVLEEILRRG
jgi:HEAT repeat protein